MNFLLGLKGSVNKFLEKLPYHFPDPSDVVDIYRSEKFRTFYGHLPSPLDMPGLSDLNRLAIILMGIIIGQV